MLSRVAKNISTAVNMPREGWAENTDFKKRQQIFTIKKLEHRMFSFFDGKVTSFEARVDQNGKA